MGSSTSWPANQPAWAPLKPPAKQVELRQPARALIIVQSR